MEGYSHRPRPSRRARATSPFYFTVWLLVGLLGGQVPAWAVGPDEASQSRRGNYDARVQHNASFGAPVGLRQQQAAAEMRSRIPGLSVRYDRVFGVAHSLSNPGGYLSAPRAAFDARSQAQSLALQFVREHRDVLGLTDNDLSEFEVTDQVLSKLTGATHLYLRQMHRGVPVYNGQLQVNVNRNGRVLSVNNAFVARISSAAGPTVAPVDASDALLAAAEHLGIAIASEVQTLSNPGGPQQSVVLSQSDLSAEPIRASLMWLPIRAGNVRLVWNFQLALPGERHYYDINVDARSARVWTRFDWVKSANYRVYPDPVESPIHTTPAPPADARTLVTDPADATASPNGWHDTGTQNFTITRGNNVHAYEDRDRNDAPPATEVDCGGSLDCDFPVNLDQEPDASIPAAVTNLFYWTNRIHDVQYQYGFDEAAGNFQENNFGRGGAGGDAVNAEAQDGDYLCNAFFYAANDGTNPRIEMFPCNWSSPSRDGDFDNGVIVHEYGHGISIRQVGGPSNSSCLNNQQQPGEGWSDWFALAYTAKAGDAGTDPRGMGGYLFNLGPTGTIRDAQYSTDPAVNNWTYSTISSMAVPHGVGSVWAQALWEVYWALVDAYGFEGDLINFDISDPAEAGNKRALFYVNEGLKNTACSPTFLDARDAIIQSAADNFGGADVCLLWQAFADFGLGVDASTGGPNTTTASDGFDIPLQCQCQPAPVADAGDDELICLGDAVTIGTPPQPSNSYSWAPGGETTAQITVAPGTTTSYTVTASTLECGADNDSVTVFVDDGSGVAGFSDDFEGDVSGWTADPLDTGVGWHRVTNSACATPGYASPSSAFYYGRDSNCHYDTGWINSGTLTSPEIAGVDASSTLSFNYYRKVESYSAGDYDKTEVSVVSPSGAETVVWSRSSRDASQATWLASGPIGLAAFAGQTIRIRFRFDSVDEAANINTGWLVDDVVVSGSSACAGGPSGNDPPSIAITAPADGYSVPEGDNVTFTASATDGEDGDISAGVDWFSSIDGDLGTGASLSTSALSVGIHTVTASATDSGGLLDSDQIEITVATAVNSAPVVTATAPADGSTYSAGTAVTFSGTAQDGQDGDISPSLSWTSSKDGGLGTGASVTASLSSGPHTVTAAATDSGGLSGSDDISVTINQPIGDGVCVGSISMALVSLKKDQRAEATVHVTDCNGNNAGFAQVQGMWETPTGSQGSQWDDTDAQTSRAVISSGLVRKNISGQFVYHVLDVTQNGVTYSPDNSVTAGCINSDGSACGAPPAPTNVPPDVSITAPPDGTSVNEGESITFTGSAVDNEDGDISTALSWSSSRDGPLGSGAWVSPTLSAGTHTVTATVTDSGAQSGSDFISVTVLGSGPVCTENGGSCSANADCCSNRCKGPSGNKVCK